MSPRTPISPMTHKARSIVLHEGKYLHLGDMKKALLDDDFVEQCAYMLLVAKERGVPWQDGMRAVIGCALMALAGEDKDLDTPSTPEAA